MPPPEVRLQTYQLNRNELGDNPGGPTLEIRSPSDLGVNAGEWMPLGVGAEMPLGQRSDDGGSLVFDSAPLDEPLTIFGSPTGALHLKSDARVVQVAVRLSDVFPDGRVTRMTYGVLNLTHCNSHEPPEALQPGVVTTSRSDST